MQEEEEKGVEQINYGTREGWPLLTVETEVNRYSKSTNAKEFSVGWLVRLVMPVSRDFYPALAALVSPVKQKFPYRTLFQSMCLHRLAQQPGQAVVQGRLSLNVCLRTRHN